MLRQQAFDRDLGLFHFRGVVLTLNRQTNLRFLKAIQHIAGRHRAETDVINLPDGRLFLDLDDNSPSLGCFLASEANVLKVTGVPQELNSARARRRHKRPPARLKMRARMVLPEFLRLPVTAISAIRSLCAQLAGDDRKIRATPAPAQTPPAFAKTVQMKKMWDGPRLKNSGSSRTQQCLNESENESLLPQALGCRKTIIIRRETESVQEQWPVIRGQ